MYVVLRRPSKTETWSIHAATATQDQAKAITERAIKDGWDCQYYDGSIVYIAENGNHTWAG